MLRKKNNEDFKVLVEFDLTKRELEECKLNYQCLVSERDKLTQLVNKQKSELETIYNKL